MPAFCDVLKGGFIMVEECYFTFANKSSEDYEICLCNIGGLIETLTSGADSEVISENVFGNEKQLVYGVRENQQLSFDLTIHFPDKMPVATLCEVKNWLFRQNKPQKLAFNHPELKDYYFWCFLRHGEDYQDGIGIKAMSITVQSISPYAYKTPILLTQNIKSSPDSTTEIYWKQMRLDIDFANIGTIKPIIKCVQNSSDGRCIRIANRGNGENANYLNTCFIKNDTLNKGDIIEIDTLTKKVTVKKTTDESPVVVNATKYLDLDGNGFIYLVNGVNILDISGDCTVTVQCTPSVRIGGV